MCQLKGETGIFVTTIFAAIVLWAAPSEAQPWPHKSVRMVVPIAPGSSPDVAARVFAERLGARWGKAVIVENRPGADGLTGTAAFVATHDDHTLLLSPAAPLTVYPAIQEKLNYDPVHDLLPISTVVETFGTIAVPSSLPIKTLAELEKFARGRPGQLNWATGGGAFPILMEGFVKSSGLEMTQVPYRDQNLALQDLAEGRVQIFATAMTAVLPLVQAGKIRVLAVTNKKHSPLWADIPTAVESGYPVLGFEGLIGVFASRGTPTDRRERIAEDIRAIALDPEVAERLGAAGQIVFPSTPTEFTSAIEEQRLNIAALVRLIGKSPK